VGGWGGGGEGLGVWKRLEIVWRFVPLSFVGCDPEADPPPLRPAQREHSCVICTDLMQVTLAFSARLPFAHRRPARSLQHGMNPEVRSSASWD
jgi:hypothetical protein